MEALFRGEIFRFTKGEAKRIYSFSSVGSVWKLSMAGTYSKSIPRVETPQYAYALAIFSGGLAFIVPQLGAHVASWLSYASLAALFGFIWPNRALQWGGWLCLPIVVLICIDFFSTGSVGVLLSTGLTFVTSFSSASLGAYVGSKLSVRKIADRSAHRQANRSRLHGNGNRTRSGPALRELAAPASSVKAISGLVEPLQAVELAAHGDGLDAALFKAVQEGDLKRVKLLVAEGADVNAESRERLLPLTIAAQGFDIEMARTLFGQGAALDGVSGWTALMVACVEGHVEIVRALLEQGAEVSARNNEGWSALRFAVSMDETEILRLLLDAGADANIKDHQSQTALMQAAGENSRESLKALLKAGADPHLKDRNQQTALRIAQRQGHTEIIKLLKEAEAQASTRFEAPLRILYDGKSKVTDKTHRVIRKCRDPYYGLIDRYDVILMGAALPSGHEETGHEGNEEECRDYAWRSNIDEPSELGWWLEFSS
jgi:ankyrin repeat protein